jgi:hypothetical protein
MPNAKTRRTRTTFASDHAPAVAHPPVGKQTRTQQQGTIAAVTDESIANSTLHAAYLVFESGQSGPIFAAPKGAYGALSRLYIAVSGKSLIDSSEVPPAQRVAMLDLAVEALAPAASALSRDQPEWVDGHYTSRIAPVRARLVAMVAHDRTRKRIDNAMLVPGTTDVIELPTGPLDDHTAAVYGEALVPTMNKTIAGATKFLSIVKKTAKMAGADRTDLLLGTALAGLKAYKALLETQEALDNPARPGDGAAKQTASYAELVKAALHATEATVELSAHVGAWVARLQGKVDAAENLLFAAKSIGKTLDVLVNAAEFVHGVAVLCDPDASAVNKLDAVVEISVGGLGLVSLVAPKAGVASSLIGLGYAMWKVDMALHAKIASDYAIGRLVPRLEKMAVDASGIRRQTDILIKACQLRDHEADPGERANLDAAVVELTRELDSAVDSYLDSCARIRNDISLERPGTNPYLRDAFAHLLSLRGHSASPEAALGKAVAVVAKIIEVLDDAHNYVRQTTGLDRKPMYRNDE